MTKLCDGRVAVVTGAGRGIGREHALMLAEQGARVIVNDLGGDEAGHGTDLTPAQQVVAEIEAMGGEAAVNGATGNNRIDYPEDRGSYGRETSTGVVEYSKGLFMVVR